MNENRSSQFEIEVKELKELTEFNDILVKYRSMIHKYGYDIRPTPKGDKIMETVLNRFYKGEKLTEKELKILSFLGYTKMMLDGKKYGLETYNKINEELLTRFGIIAGEGLEIEIVNEFFLKGIIEKNPNYIPNIKPIMQEIVKAKKGNIHGVNEFIDKE